MKPQMSRNVVIVNELGLHARSAAKIAKLAQQAIADVNVSIQEAVTGITVAKNFRREQGVYEVIDKSNGFTMLRCLTQMVVALGFPGTALLFDEVDRLR